MNPETPQAPPQQPLSPPPVTPITPPPAPQMIEPYPSPKPSLRERFKNMPRTAKVLAIVGTAMVLLIAVTVGATLAGRDNADAPGPTSTTDKNGDGVPDDTAISYAIADSNGDGVIDSKDETVAGDNNGDGVVDSRDTNTPAITDEDINSWWENILNTTIPNKDDQYTIASPNGTITVGDDGEWLEDDNVSDPGFDDDEIDFSSYGTPDAINEVISSTIANPITIATWNTLFDNSLGNIAKGAKAVAGKADIIGFQEFHRADRRKSMRDAILCSSCAFKGYVRDYTTSASTPASVAIVWRKNRFSLLDSGYRKVSPAQSISTKTGITGNRVSAKWIAWVKLRDKKTNKQFYMLNTHTVASVESKGKPIGSEDDRLRIYKQHMNALTDQINKFKSSKLPIFITGDFNVNYRYDSRVKYKDFPYKRLSAIGVHSSYQRLNLAGISKSAQTHGNGTRLIDYIWSIDNPNVVSKSILISGSSYGSDHFPVYYSFGIK